MDERKQKNIDPWDEAEYGTGNTRPPKSYGGIIAMLLIVVIFLSGIVSVLSFLNVQLFQHHLLKICLCSIAVDCIYVSLFLSSQFFSIALYLFLCQCPTALITIAS